MSEARPPTSKAVHPARVSRGALESAAVGVLAVIAVAVACGHGGEDARYPARPEGCEVKVFADTPNEPVDNLGPVEASCSPDIPQNDCLRSLKDAVCNLGGDVAWGIGDHPTQQNGRNRWFGRAAHTKSPAATPKPAPLAAIAPDAGTR